MFKNDASSNIPYETMNSPPHTRTAGDQTATSNKGFRHRPWAFHFGVFLSIIGSSVFLGSICSNNWIYFNADGLKVPLEKRKTLLAHYGPWEACNHGSKCGPLWEMAPGLNKAPVRLTQLVFRITACLYIFGVFLILLNWTLGCSTFTSCLPCFNIIRVFRRKIVNTILPEMVLPVAAVTGFLAMLLMGELKNCVILREHQTQHVGGGLFACLSGVVVTVFGVLFVLLTRFITDSSRIAKYIYRLSRKKKTRPSCSFTPKRIYKGVLATGDTRDQSVVESTMVKVPVHESGHGEAGSDDVDQLPENQSHIQDGVAAPQRQWVSGSGVVNNLVSSEI